jgi:DNA-directed RNA polymerase
VEKQSDLNKEMLAAARRSAEKARVAGVTKENELVSAPVRRLLSGSIPRLSIAIKDWIVLASTRPGANHSSVLFLKLLKPEVSAVLVGRTVMNSVSTQKPMTNLCVRIGEAIEDELRMKRFKSKLGSKARQTIKRLNKTKKGYDFRRRCARLNMKRAGVAVAYWDKRQRLHVGAALLDLFIKHTGLVKIAKRYDGPNRYTNVIVATDECMDWIKNYMESEEVLEPRFMPMIEKPTAWSQKTFFDGGYAIDGFPQKFVKSRAKRLDKELSEVEMPVVYACANSLQGTAWKVSKWVYEIMRDYWDRGLSEGDDLPINYMVPMPEKPYRASKDYKKEAWRSYKKQAAFAFTINSRLKAKRIAICQTIYMAHKFLEKERIYFPVQLDFRGRCYYLPSFLNPQGSDYARALLEFADGEALTQEGARWFRIYGANLFGNDKVTHQERVDWVGQNVSKIQASAADPYQCKWWQQAKNRWQFLRWCKEYSEFLKDPSYKVKTPVTVDCTSSGLQVLALLTRDSDLATRTNLTNCPRLYDVYTEALVEFMGRMQSQPENHVARLWLQLVPDRSLTKPCVMTIPYGGTRYSTQRAADEWLRSKMSKFGELKESKDLWPMASLFTSEIRKVAAKLLPKAVECMEWMTKVAKASASNKNSLSWVSQSGFVVIQPYMKSKSITVKTSLAGSCRFFMLREDSEKFVDVEKQYKSVAPNFIHSLDASVVHLAFSNVNFPAVAIHDCYGAHANNIEALIKNVKEAFVKVFSSNNLQLFQTAISNSNKEISTASTFVLGSFDPCLIRDAAYTFG